MATSTAPIRIGIHGTEARHHVGGRGCGLWPTGYVASVRAAGGDPVFLDLTPAGGSWDEALQGVQAVILTGTPGASARQLAEEERLCRWCQRQRLPVLAIDHGLLVLNGIAGGTLYEDLAHDLPEALQHRHPPEKGQRHAIQVEPGTRLADIYGEGEVAVNSEHRQAVRRVGRGFIVSARALDGVIEAIEADRDDWFALGVQWHPASDTASGLDIQLFRGLVGHCERRVRKPARTACVTAA